MLVAQGQQYNIISGRDPPLYFTLTIFTMQGHQNKRKYTMSLDAKLLKLYEA